MKAFRFVLMSLPLAITVGCGGGYDSPSGPDVPRPSRVVTGSGDLTATVADFRAVLGDPNNGGELFDEMLANLIGERLDPPVWEALNVSDQSDWQRAAAALRGEARRADAGRLSVSVSGRRCQYR